MKKILGTIYFIVFLSNTLFSQHTEYRIGGEFLSGYIPAHSPQFRTDPSEFLSWGVGVEFMRRILDSTDYRLSLNHPGFSITMQYHALGDTEVYGHAFSIAPSYTFFLKQLPLYLRLDCGFAYLNKQFDENSNPENRAIGSSINNVTKLRVGYRTHFHNWSYGLYLGLTHYSNLSTIEPNLGLNHVGIGLTISKKTIKKHLKPVNNSMLPSAWFRQIKYSFALYDSERELADDVHTYSQVHNIALIVGKRYRSYGRWYGQFKYTRNAGERDFHGPEGLHNLTLLAGHELTMGKFSFITGLGTYLYERYDPVEPVFIEGGANYYLLSPPHRVRPYLSVHIKSHLGVAEYGELSVGIEW